MKARKLASGNWRTQIYDYTDVDGKKHYRSFTATTKKESEYLAANFKLNNAGSGHGRDMTFGEALDKYISIREAVLSPATIREYRRIRKSSLTSLMDIKLKNINQNIINNVIKQEAIHCSAKTVRDRHGLISSVLKMFLPNLVLNTTLPKKIRPDLYIPSDDDIKKILDVVSMPEYEQMQIAILLAAFGPMRRGEICALDSSNINGNTVHVMQTMVQDYNRKWVIKAPKSYAGDRYITFPDFVSEKLSKYQGRVVNLNPNVITSRFAHILKRAGVHHFRFHDLRHYCASIQHALGVPDAYIMERGGWSNDGVLKNVYRHAMEQEEKRNNDKVNNYFKDMLNSN